MSGCEAAILGGLRTPFAKRGTALRRASDLELGRAVSIELLERLDLAAEEVDQVVFGRVVPSLESPNLAREIVLGAGLPPRIEGHTISKACITSYQTTIDAVRAIREGAADCVLAGGAESVSRVPVAVSEGLREVLLEAEDAGSVAESLRAFGALRPSDLSLHPPELAEPSTGETMGEAAERMAKEHGISRQEQDAFAHQSHLRAAEAWEEGRYDDQVMPLHLAPEYEETLVRDNLVRADSELERYAELEPVFDPRYGTVTAGNSSPLTDGAAALLLMRSDKARALGYEPLGFVRSYAFVALDPADQLLLGPAYAVPLALDRAALDLEDMDLVDVHEAFAATVLVTLRALYSEEFARRELGRSSATGSVDPERLNVGGGSIALGHPFAATGARQILQTLSELRRRGGGTALVTACAAGGMGAAVVLETP